MLAYNLDMKTIGQQEVLLVSSFKSCIHEPSYPALTEGTLLEMIPGDYFTLFKRGHTPTD